jgi:hypothetical protein
MSTKGALQMGTGAHAAAVIKAAHAQKVRRDAFVGPDSFLPPEDPGLSVEPQPMSTKAAHAHFVSGLTSKPRDQGHALQVAKMAAHVGAETATSRASSLTTTHKDSKTGDLRDMQRGARDQHEEFKEKVTGLATKYSSGPDAASVPPIKGLQRAAQKTDEDYKGNAANMKDFNRSTVFFDTTKDARAAAEKVRADAEASGKPMDPSHYKDNFDKPAGDMNLSLPMRNGQRGEAQFHVKELKKYKDEVGHKLYEVDRAFKRDDDKNIVNEDDRAFSGRIAALQQEHIKQRSARQGQAVGDGGTWNDGELDAMKEHPTFQEVLARLHANEGAAAGGGAGAALDESQVYSAAGTRSMKKKIKAAEASFRP